MSGSARVESIEPLKALRRTMFKFAEAANSALTDAESDLARTLMWVTMEQTSFWTMQIRKRTEMVSRCAEAVRMKQLFKDSTGRTSSAVDEQKALEAAKRALEVAHLKAANCKSWSRKLEREVQNYRGGVQRFATSVQSDLPVAAAKLSSAIISLEQYAALRSPTEAASTSLAASESSDQSESQDQSQSMARPAAEKDDRAPVEEKRNRDMGVYEARGQLAKGLKQLMLSWSEAKVGWDDAISHALEEEFIEPVQADLRSAIAAIDHAGAVIAQARRDCQE